jgi:hypothetical protein
MLGGLIYVYFIFIIGFIFLYLEIKIIENSFINYRLNMERILNKINYKFDIFEKKDMETFDSMNNVIDKIKI